MYRDSSVSHDGFGSRGGDFDVAHASGLRRTRKRDARAAFFDDLVADEIQIPCLRLVNHLLVGNGSLRRRIPIDHPAATIDQALVVKIDKNSLDRGGITSIKRVALARPIARTAEPLKLLDDDTAMLVLPFQNSAQEFFAAEIVACLVLGLAQIFLHSRLGSNSRMIHSRQPKDLEPLHPRAARENVLDRVV